jgi:nucleoside-triphosphatase THEP1
MDAMPLEKSELKWLKKLQKVLNECPTSRLGAYTIGDANLSIYDKEVYDAYVQANPRRQKEQDDVLIIDECGAHLEFLLKFPFKVDGIAG